MAPNKCLMVSFEPIAATDEALAAWRAAVSDLMAYSGATYRDIAAAAGKRGHTSVMRCINGQRRPSIAMMRLIDGAIGKILLSPLAAHSLEMTLATEMPDLFDLLRVEAFLDPYFEVVFAGIEDHGRSSIVRSILGLSEADVRALVASLNEWMPIVSSCTCETRIGVVAKLRSYGIVVPDGAEECIDCAGGARVGIDRSAEAFKTVIRRVLISPTGSTPASLPEVSDATCRFLRDIGDKMRQQEERIDAAYGALDEVQQMIKKATQSQSPKDRESILAKAQTRLNRTIAKEKYIREQAKFQAE